MQNINYGEASCRSCSVLFFKKSKKHFFCSAECRTAHWELDENKILNRFQSKIKDAAKRGIEFNLTFQEFSELWKKPCYYCGADIVGIGIDRSNNLKGYEPGNIVPACYTCNGFKRTNTEVDFINHCRTIVSIADKRLSENLNKL